MGDHRHLDGAALARFSNSFKSYMEDKTRDDENDRQNDEKKRVKDVRKTCLLFFFRPFFFWSFFGHSQNLIVFFGTFSENFSDGFFLT